MNITINPINFLFRFLYITLFIVLFNNCDKSNKSTGVFVDKLEGVQVYKLNNFHSEVIGFLKYGQKINILNEGKVSIVNMFGKTEDHTSYNIKTSNFTGWVLTGVSNKKPDLKLLYRVVADEGLNIRKEPSIDSKVIDLIPHLTTGDVIGISDRFDTINGKTAYWVKIKYRGQEGWLYSGFVELHHKNYDEDNRYFNPWKTFNGSYISKIDSVNTNYVIPNTPSESYSFDNFQVKIFKQKNPNSEEKNIIMVKDFIKKETYISNKYRVYKVMPNFPLVNTITFSVGTCYGCDEFPYFVIFVPTKGGFKEITHFSTTELKSTCENTILGLEPPRKDYVATKINENKTKLLSFKRRAACDLNIVNSEYDKSKDYEYINNKYFNNELFIKIYSDDNQYNISESIDVGIPQTSLSDWNKFKILN